MLSSGVLLPGDNTEIQAGGVKKSIFFFQAVDEQNRKAESKQRACWQAVVRGLLSGARKAPRCSRLQEGKRKRGGMSNC